MPLLYHRRPTHPRTAVLILKHVPQLLVTSLAEQVRKAAAGKLRRRHLPHPIGPPSGVNSEMPPLFSPDMSLPARIISIVRLPFIGSITRRTFRNCAEVF
jgi:hypothetical protein